MNDHNDLTLIGFLVAILLLTFTVFVVSGLDEDIPDRICERVACYTPTPEAQP